MRSVDLLYHFFFAGVHHHLVFFGKHICDCRPEASDADYSDSLALRRGFQGHIRVVCCDKNIVSSYPQWRCRLPAPAHEVAWRDTFRHCRYRVRQSRPCLASSEAPCQSCPELSSEKSALKPTGKQP